MVPMRGEGSAFGAAVNATVVPPEPAAAESTVSHAESDTAVHAQLVPAVRPNVPEPPDAATLPVDGAIE